MYVLARSAPRAPLGHVFWTGRLTPVELDDGARVERAEIGYFPADAWGFESFGAALEHKYRNRLPLTGFVPVSFTPARLRPRHVPLH